MPPHDKTDIRENMCNVLSSIVKLKNVVATNIQQKVQRFGLDKLKNPSHQDNHFYSGNIKPTNTKKCTFDGHRTPKLG